MEQQESNGDIEEELDLLCCELLELLQEIHQRKQEQEKHLQEGNLCLAKARYAIGVDRVSQLQYPSEMTPLTKVKQSLDSDDSSFEILRLDQITTEKPADDERRNEQSSLRKRVTRKQGDSTENNDSDKDGDVVKSSFVEDVDRRKSYQNPLDWFGVLVPRSLRLAQTSFLKAIDDSCAICNLKLRLENAIARYRSARKIQDRLDETCKTTNEIGPISSHPLEDNEPT